MFHLWFNTSYVENNYLRFTKAVTDKACKDLKCKHFSNDFEVELFFEPYDENDASGKSSDFSFFLLVLLPFYSCLLVSFVFFLTHILLIALCALFGLFVLLFYYLDRDKN